MTISASWFVLLFIFWNNEGRIWNLLMLLFQVTLLLSWTSLCIFRYFLYTVGNKLLVNFYFNFIYFCVLQSYPDSATTLHFEAYSGSGDASSRAEATGGSSKPYAATMPVQITSVHLLARDKTSSQIMDDILQQYRVPQDKQVRRL